MIEADAEESERGLIAYRNFANEIPAQNPHLCKVAGTALKSAADYERPAQLNETALLFGSSVFALACCTSLVPCSAALSATEYRLSH